jgi:transcriptional regulator with XRE-family HTH domain
MEMTYGALTDRAHTDADSGLTALLAALIDRTGSGAAAARTLGVSRSTVYRWLAGRHTPKVSSLTLARAVRRAGLTASLEADIKKKRRIMVIHGVIKISNDERPRKLKVGQYIPERKMGNIINAWLDANDERTERLLWASIDKHYTEGIEITVLTGVEFE